MKKDSIINLTATIEKRISQESGKDYEVLMINLTDDYTKEVYISRAESQLLHLVNKSSTNMPSFL